MIELHQYHPTFGLPNASPFCLKAETFLRMVQLPYENVYINDPRVSPTAKLPFIKDEGQVIADSRFIVKYLINKYNLDIDNHLSAAEHGKGVAITRLLEESLYWALVYSRWGDDHFWPKVKEHYFAHLKKPLSLFLPALIRKAQQKAMWGQGIGRLEAAQRYELAETDIRSLSDMLGDQPYILGGKISSYDASVYGFLANIVFPELPTPIQVYAKNHGNLQDYCERMRKAFFVGS